MQGASVSGPGTDQSGTAGLRLGRMGEWDDWGSGAVGFELELGRLDWARNARKTRKIRSPGTPGSAAQRLSFSHVIESPGVEGLPSVPPGLTG